MNAGYSAPTVSAPTLAADLAGLLQSGDYADVSIIVDERDVIRCHRCVLTLRCSSELWNGLLYELGTTIRTIHYR